MKRQATPEQKAKAEARRAAAKALAKQIADMTPEERAEFASRCPVVTITGHHLSPVNTCLVALQKPDASIVGGFRQWITAGRAVRKGEHGLSIWVPIGAGRDANAGQAKPEGEASEEGSRPGFILGVVFDVSQTDEKTLAQMKADSEANAAALNSEMEVA